MFLEIILYKLQIIKLQKVNVLLVSNPYLFLSGLWSKLSEDLFSPNLNSAVLVCPSCSSLFFKPTCLAGGPEEDTCNTTTVAGRPWWLMTDDWWLMTDDWWLTDDDDDDDDDDWLMMFFKSTCLAGGPQEDTCTTTTVAGRPWWLRENAESIIYHYLYLGFLVEVV